VRKAKPSKDVLSACSAVERAALAVKTKLTAYDAPQKAWQKAIVERDALLVPWQKSLTRLRVLAKASFIDDEGAYEALFAAPEAVTVPKRTRKKVRAKNTESKPIAPA